MTGVLRDLDKRRVQALVDEEVHSTAPRVGIGSGFTTTLRLSLRLFTADRRGLPLRGWAADQSGAISSIRKEVCRVSARPKHVRHSMYWDTRAPEDRFAAKCLTIGVDEGVRVRKSLDPIRHPTPNRLNVKALGAASIALTSERRACGAKSRPAVYQTAIRTRSSPVNSLRASRPRRLFGPPALAAL
ncbi:hypothetical protein LTR94_024839 [Friedmanniomyces endolithicus]|nr:hypothetical protein LTR94_024839 [Friedmanniomyces endolithicus]